MNLLKNISLPEYKDAIDKDNPFSFIESKLDSVWAEKRLIFITENVCSAL